MSLMFILGHEIKLPLFISMRKFIGGGMKPQPWKYWINYVLVLSLVMIAWDLCHMGLSMGISLRLS